ncbi:MAG: trypsin-like peptidase domain-containing protein [Nitrospirae bacterium]|nr:trypsin-like peptidase domain-containing protein [Nitrospirota bacterium]
MDKNDLKQYFDILEIEPTESLDKIKQTYDDLIKIWNTDRFYSDPILIQKAIEKTKLINNAYDYLSNYYINNDDLKQYFTILEIAPTNSLNKIYQAFKELSKIWHPSNFSNDIILQKKAEEKMKSIKQSYDFLYEYFSDKEKDKLKNQDKKHHALNIDKKYILIILLFFLICIIAFHEPLKEFYTDMRLAYNSDQRKKDIIKEQEMVNRINQETNNFGQKMVNQINQHYNKEQAIIDEKTNKVKTLSTEEIVQRSQKAVVVIINEASNCAGSGFVYSQNGYILTNAHVIKESNEVKVKFYNGKIMTAAVIKVETPPLDVAILKIEGNGYDVIPIGDSDKCNSGEDVIAIGSPLVLEQTVTKGIISNCNRQLSGIKYIQIDVPTTHGNSGCPLINNKGEAIGIVTLGAKTQGFNFALAINEARTIIEFNYNTSDWYEKGINAGNAGRWIEALNAFNKVIEKDSQNVLAYNYRGISQVKLQDYVQAINNFDKAVELNPQFAEAYNNRGFSYIELGEYNKAIGDFNKAIEINPQFARAYFNRGKTIAQLMGYEKAIPDYKIAAKMGDKDAQNILRVQCAPKPKGFDILGR